MKTKVMNSCKKYELAITNYAMGEDMPISKDELFGHLRNCAKCRADLVDWQDMYASWRTEGSLSQPEVKKRVEALLTEVNRQPLPTQTRPSSGFPTGKVAAWQVPKVEPIPGEKFLKHEEDIGTAAVKVWHYLYGNGKIKVNDLERKVKLPAPVLNQALGWLARGNQIHRTRVKKSTFVYLAPEEIQKHQAQV